MTPCLAPAPVPPAWPLTPPHPTCPIICRLSECSASCTSTQSCHKRKARGTNNDPSSKRAVTKDIMNQHSRPPPPGAAIIYDVDYGDLYSPPCTPISYPTAATTTHPPTPTYPWSHGTPHHSSPYTPPPPLLPLHPTTFPYTPPTVYYDELPLPTPIYVSNLEWFIYMTTPSEPWCPLGSTPPFIRPYMEASLQIAPVRQMVIIEESTGISSTYSSSSSMSDPIRPHVPE